MSPAIWLPLVVADYILCAWLTHKNSEPGSARLWFWISYSTTLIPLWTIVARHSKNVVYDGLLFDVTMTVTYTMAILYFTKSFGKLGFSNYLGLVCILAGIWLFKRGT